MTQVTNYLTYLYLLTPLHTGGSVDEGNLMGIAREVHTEFPYLPASSLRGKIRAQMESDAVLTQAASRVFGQKIENGQQPTEGQVWFADASLLFFPIASLSHHLIWITCPLWLERWSRWLGGDTTTIQSFIQDCRDCLSGTNDKPEKSAIVSSLKTKVYLQTALLQEADLVCKDEDFKKLAENLKCLTDHSGLIVQLLEKLIVLSDEDCIALVETGLQREVRVALETDSKTVKGGSFRSEEAIPPETVLFFPWGMKPVKPLQPDPNATDKEQARAIADKQNQDNTKVRENLVKLLGDRLQFGGLEGLGRGWAELKTVEMGKGK